MIPPALLKNVLARITPTKEERAAEEKMVHLLIQKIKTLKGPHVGAILAGSLARNTHLKGDRDLDIFVFYPTSLSREKFEVHGLKVGHSVFGRHFHEEAYSEHPYVRGIMDGFNVEIVPTYKVNKAHEKLSAVDRTPFHAEYVKKNLSEKTQGEVRLLKQFLKGIGAYGADVKMHGVPGYLVEILILQYGSFASALENIAKWRQPTIIDVDKHYPNPQEVVRLFPKSFLIVIDPTDKTRNVAAALSLNQFARVIAAARAFLQKPSEKFFFAHEEQPLTISQIRSRLKTEEWMGISFPFPNDTLEDVMWGQLSRVNQKLVNLLVERHFTIRRHFEWTDGKNTCVVLLDVENPTLQPSEVRVGPPITDQTSCLRFLAAHQKPLSGPRIENGRLVVIEKRPIFAIEKALSTEWKRLAQSESAKELKSALQKGKTVDERSLIGLAQKNKFFAHALGRFLRGKEWFL